VFAALSEMIPLVKRDAGTLLRDARDLLAGHFERWMGRGNYLRVSPQKFKCAVVYTITDYIDQIIN
jgi:hypothetical protein